MLQCSGQSLEQVEQVRWTDSSALSDWFVDIVFWELSFCLLCLLHLLYCQYILLLVDCLARLIEP